jgi:hypothetical protein
MDPKDSLIGNLVSPKREEPDAELDEFARLVIGAAIECTDTWVQASWKKSMKRRFAWSSNLGQYPSCVRNEWE